MPDVSALFTSQPGWVVVSVILIAAAAYVLRPVLVGRLGRDEVDEPEPVVSGAHSTPEGETLRSGRGRGYDAILDALDRLHEVATREAARGDEAERERDELGRALERALRDLADCERRAVAGPVRSANEYADRRHVGAVDARRARHRVESPTDPRVRWAPRDAG